jgi:hypothetical protein
MYTSFFLSGTRAVWKDNFGVDADHADSRTTKLYDRRQQVLLREDLIKADPEAALHKLRRCGYLRLAAIAGFSSL